MQRHTLAAFASLALVASAASVRAQELTATPSGEVLVRYRHFEGHDLAPGGVDDFVRQRARVGLRFAFGTEVQAFVQLQDVRTWGEETDTLSDFSGDGIDLHQGFIEAELAPDLRLRLGRQEVSYLNQRLIGNVGFAEQGRSFDAARLMGVFLDQTLAVDVLYAHVREDAPAETRIADNLGALAVRYQMNDYFQPAMLLVVDTHTPTQRARVTSGLVIQSEMPFGLKASLEGYFQAGTANVEGTEIGLAAWMFAARLRFTLVDSDFAPFLEAFAETLSGDDDPTDTAAKSFDTLFATNHKFYGEADFFVNIPVDTANRGLLDAGAVLGTKLGEDATAQLAFHVFQAMAPQGGPSSFGQELDLTFGWKPNPHLSLDLNYSLFFPGDGLRADGELEHFVYSTASASF